MNRTARFVLKIIAASLGLAAIVCLIIGCWGGIAEKCWSTTIMTMRSCTRDRLLRRLLPFLKRKRSSAMRRIFFTFIQWNTGMGTGRLYIQFWKESFSAEAAAQIA